MAGHPALQGIEAPAEWMNSAQRRSGSVALSVQCETKAKQHEQRATYSSSVSRHTAAFQVSQ
jgi:hypothetical protein